jgi:uncharacterized protein (DUF58 family)
VTKRGVVVLGVVVLAWVLAARWHYTVLGVVSVAGITALVSGLGWVARRPRLAIHREIDPVRVTRGELALGVLSIHNPSNFAFSPTYALEILGEVAVTVEVPRLRAGSTTRTTYRLPTDRRAAVDVGPLTITRQDPFAMWKTSQRVGARSRLWVHPVTHRLIGLPVGRTRSLDGPDDDRMPHGSITFHALRQYVAGDDLRRVHWPSSARLDTLMVRENVDTSLPQVTLVLDTSASSYRGEAFEDAVEAAASVAVVGTQMRFSVRLITASGQMATGTRVAGQASNVLDYLAEVKLTETVGMDGVASRLRHESRGDVLVIITGDNSEANVQPIAVLGRRFGTGVVAIVGSSAEGAVCRVPSNMRVLRAVDGADFASQWNSAMGR